MKKLLLASAVVAMSASVAGAQNVTFNGDGRMGVQRTGGATNVQGRIRFNMNWARQGDNGLAFGGTLRLGQNFRDGGSTAIGPQNGAVFIEAAGLRLTMGDIDGAVANTVSLYGGGLGFTGGVGRPSTHGFNGGFTEGDTGSTSTVRVNYAIEGFSVALSTRPTPSGTPSNRSTEIAVGYSMPGVFGVALGYSQNRNVALSATYTAGDFGVGALVTRLRAGGANVTNWRVWGTYDIGDIRLGLTHTRATAVDATGLGIRYSLGGGAFMHGAVESVRARAGGGRTTGGEIGVTFSF